MLVHITSTHYVPNADRLVNTINQSVGVDSAWTVAMVARQISRVASTHPENAELLAHLCIRVAEQLSDDVCHEDVRYSEGKPLSGGRLFHAKLLGSCQSLFKLRMAALGLGDIAYTQDADEPEAVVQARNESLRKTLEEVKSEGPGLVRFLGELLKIRFLSPFVVLGGLRLPYAAGRCQSHGDHRLSHCKSSHQYVVCISSCYGRVLGWYRPG